MLRPDYDVVVIGAGMSGLAASIRSSLLGNKVLNIEKHFLPGGLNSYYFRGKREFDVGLHALTNFARKGMKKKPLLKVLRQLRIPYDLLKLEEQQYSKVVFQSKEIRFGNQKEILWGEIEKNFPQEFLNFQKLWKVIEEYSDDELYAPYMSTLQKLQEFFHDHLLIQMLLAPCLIYGSAVEHDMDFSQFVIMFRSLYMEGFSRPKGGIRPFITLLLEKLKEVGGKLSYRKEATKLEKEGEFWHIYLKSGEKLTSRAVISTIGVLETLKLLPDEKKSSLLLQKTPKIGQMSFTETNLVLKKKIAREVEESAIVFYNRKDRYNYFCPQEFYDTQSAVLCFPDNYGPEEKEGEGRVRLTFMANYNLWKELSKKDYLIKKKEVLDAGIQLLKEYLPNFKEEDILFSDVFTPLTVERYTGHLGGAVYGSPDKIKMGKLTEDGLYLAGTDQGFLGIVGALLSGLTLANFYETSKGGMTP